MAEHAPHPSKHDNGHTLCLCGQRYDAKHLIAAGWRSPDEVAREVEAAEQRGRAAAAQAIEAAMRDPLFPSVDMVRAARLARGEQP